MTHLSLSVSHFASLAGASGSPQFQVLFCFCWGDFSADGVLVNTFFFGQSLGCWRRFYLLLLFRGQGLISKSVVQIVEVKFHATAKSVQTDRHAHTTTNGQIPGKTLVCEATGSR